MSEQTPAQEIEKLKAQVQALSDGLTAMGMQALALSEVVQTLVVCHPRPGELKAALRELQKFTDQRVRESGATLEDVAALAQFRDALKVDLH